MLEKKIEMIFNYAPICNSCLGRQFSKLLSQTTNEKRGEALRMKYALQTDASDKTELSENMKINLSEFAFNNIKFENPKKMSECQICRGLFNNEEKLIEDIKESIEGIDFDTFSVGVRLSDDLFEEEENLWEDCGIDFCEGIKSHISRNIGLTLKKQLKKEVNLLDPVLSILIDLSTNQIKIKTKAFYIKGYCSKFQKIPLLKQFCHTCYGIGCRSCNYGGITSPMSVHGLIERHLLIKTLGIETKFHTTGFESANFLFSGKRPFVIEIKNSRKRKINLKNIEKAINKEKAISVCNLEFSTKKEMVVLKSMGFSRKYHIKMTLKNSNDFEKLKDILIQNKIKILSEKIKGNCVELILDKYTRELNAIETTKNSFIDILEFKNK